MRLSIRSSGAASSLLLLLLQALLLPQSTTAFGGFFGRAPPEQPVTSTKDAIVYGVNGTTVTMQVAINYAGAGDAFTLEPSNFSWIVPVPAIPNMVEQGSSLLMNALFQHTRPDFELEIYNTTEELQSGLNPSTACLVEALQEECPFQGPSRGTGGFSPFGPLSPVALEQGRAGILNYAILQGTAEDVLGWLTESSYTLPSDTTALTSQLSAYAEKGHVFIAVQLAPDVPQGAAQPLMIQYELNSTVDVPLYSVPLMLSKSKDLTLQIYFLSDVENGRALPVNYLDVTLDNAYVDWVGCHGAEGGDDACYWDDYEHRVQTVVKSLANHSVVTEYAGPADVLETKVAVNMTGLEDLSAATNWLEFLELMEAADVPANAQLQEIVLQYIPIAFAYNPPFQCVQWKEIYHPGGSSEGPTMDDCFEIFDPPADWTWDPVGLADALMTGVFGPAAAAQGWVDQFAYLTRFIGYVPDTDALQKEPHFAIDTSGTAEQVSRHHSATAIPVCELGDGRNPSSLEITLTPKNEEDEVVRFWQAAYLDCGWKKSAPSIVWSLDQAFPRPFSYAGSLTAHGIANTQPTDDTMGMAVDGVHVVKNETSSDGVMFDPDALEEAIAYGDALLASLSTPEASPPSTADEEPSTAAPSSTADEEPSTGGISINIISSKTPTNDNGVSAVQAAEKEVEDSVEEWEHSMLRASGAVNVLCGWLILASPAAILVYMS